MKPLGRQPFLLTYQSIALHGRSDLFTARCHSERALALDSVVERLFDETRWAGHVLVAAVGATTDEA